MNVLETELPGVLLVEPAVFRDARGCFFETWHERRYGECGLPERFVQDNVSRSRHGVLRGLHYQEPHAQGKLVTALDGEIFDVAVDIRTGSPTFGRWVGYVLSAQNARQLYIPEGFAHGFAILSASAVVSYKCTDFYAPGAEGGVRWDDPEIGIDWPVREPVLSPKDAAAPYLSSIPPHRLPHYAPAPAASGRP